jgi:uncharacterized Fe-S center protein
MDMSKNKVRLQSPGCADKRGRSFLTVCLAAGFLFFALAGQGCAVIEAKRETAVTKPEKAPAQAADKGADVYFTGDISGKGLLAVYKRLNAEVEGKVVIKLHMGERGNTNYLSPALLRDLSDAVRGTLADSNVLYGGARGTTAGHLAVAKEHGFTFAPVDILDAEGDSVIRVAGGNRLKEAIVGSHILNYDWLISVAHFKGHGMAGFGGTFKNIAVGVASPRGKRAIHSSGEGTFSSTGEPFLEKVVEYAKAVIDIKKGKVLYINVLNNLSVDCDCDARAAHPSMPDIGILASLDPVALEKASLDLIYARPDEEKKHLAERIQSRNGAYQIEYAEKLGMGSAKYKLVKID